MIHVILQYCNTDDFTDIHAYFHEKDVALNERVKILKVRMKSTDILHLYRYKKPRLPSLSSAASSQQKKINKMHKLATV